MKKILALAITMIMVLGASFAMAADVEIGGDARVRGVWQKNFDADENTADDYRVWDQRFRLKVTGSADDVKVVTRITVSDGIWGANTAADNYGPVLLDDDDYAYIVAPVGPVTITAGRQLADWGNKYLTWGAPKNRFKIIYKTDSGITTGLFIDKNTERLSGGNDGDNDSYVIPVIGTFGDFKAGLLFVHNIAGGIGVDSTAGEILDLYVNGQAGGMSVMGELGYMTGDNYDVNGSARMGLMAGVGLEMSGLNVSAAVAFADNSYASSKYFTPTLLFGKSQCTAIMDFSAPADESAFAVVVGVDMPMGDAMGVGAKLAMADGFIKDASIIEVDGTFKYKLNDNAAWMFDLAIGMPDKIGNDDMIMSLAQRLEVSF